MDYQKAFDWVAEQVHDELCWTAEEIEDSYDGDSERLHGMLFAYRSINELIEKLKKYGPDEYERQCKEVAERFSK
jgi:hypothetical protein